MVSVKVPETKPQNTMENKTSKAISIIKSFFNSKRKDKSKTVETPKIEVQKPEPPNPVDSVLETFKKLDLNKQNNKEVTKKVVEQKQEEFKAVQKIVEEEDEDSEDELKNFDIKVIEEDRRSFRIDSHSSGDSGFTDVKVQEDVTESFEKLRLQDKKEVTEEKKKKIKQVYLIRGPDRIKKVTERNTHPYNAQTERNQINQVNTKALSGGHVTVNPTSTVITSTAPQNENYNEFDIASKEVEIKSQYSVQANYSDYLEDVMDLIQRDIANNFINELFNVKQNAEIENLVNLNQEAVLDQVLNGQLQNFYQPPNTEFVNTNVQNTEFQFPSPSREFTTLPNYEESIELTNPIMNFDANAMSIFPTPPRSETVPSPMSESQASFYPSNSDYTLSPERSSPIYNSDLEKYQDISHFDDFSEKTDTKKERNSSVSSLTLKNFKDMQKEIANGFSKKDCCSINRKSCKEIFDEHMSKLKAVDKKNICLQVSKIDLRTCYGVLQHVLLSISRGSEQEDLETALFVLLARRVLMQAPHLYLGDLGLNLLKSSALRCPHRPYFTRVVVECVYAALKHDQTFFNKEFIFHEVDAQGDNLIIACARGGDEFALVLAELTTPASPRLFKVEHFNTEGHTALHVACSQHSASSPRLHVVHVLLDHANVDLWKGDAKGGDTALHLAVNSMNCDLNLILMLFRHIDRKLWKKLAHFQNTSSVTPLEYARSATRSATRDNYPQEVLSFLMKCR